MNWEHSVDDDDEGGKGMKHSQHTNNKDRTLNFKLPVVP